MGGRSEKRGLAGPKIISASAGPAKFRCGSEARLGIRRRKAMLMVFGMPLAVALVACADKPPPAEVTPFAFPAVGAGQKDTAQFGARSGPTVP